MESIFVFFTTALKRCAILFIIHEFPGFSIALYPLLSFWIKCLRAISNGTFTGVVRLFYIRY